MEDKEILRLEWRYR